MQLCGLFTEIVWCQVNMTYLVLITKDTFVYVAPASVGANSSSNFSPIKKFKRIDWTGRKNIEYFGLHWDSKKILRVLYTSSSTKELEMMNSTRIEHALVSNRIRKTIA